MIKRQVGARSGSWMYKAARDGVLGLAVYGSIAVIALEDRAQAGLTLISKQHGFFTQSAMWSSDSPYFTLFVLGILFAVLTAFTLGAWRHFSQTIMLSRVRGPSAIGWSKPRRTAYLNKR